MSAGFGAAALGSLAVMAGLHDAAVKRRAAAEEEVALNGWTDPRALAEHRGAVEALRGQEHGAGIVATANGILAGVSMGIVITVHLGRRP